MDDLPEDDLKLKKTTPFFTLETLFYKYRFFLLTILVSLVLLSLGAIYIKGGVVLDSTKIEVINPSTEPLAPSSYVVEVGGAVQNPGVYKLPQNSRIEDVLIAAGGLSGDADRVWVDKFINRAAKVTDGQKIYIVSANQQSTTAIASNKAGDNGTTLVLGVDTAGLVNINTAGTNDLDKLPGIGPTYAQRIIDNRPYSEITELLSKKILSQSIFEKIKDKISIY